jgi:hypothetical protein
MELYNNSDKVDIMNTSMVSTQEFTRMSKLSMRIYSWKGREYYSFAMFLANGKLDELTLNKIKSIDSSIITENNNYITFESEVLKGIVPDTNLTKILKKIINILYSSGYFVKDKTVGISYEYDDEFYNGRLIINNLI